MLGSKMGVIIMFMRCLKPMTAPIVAVQFLAFHGVYSLREANLPSANISLKTYYGGLDLTSNLSRILNNGTNSTKGNPSTHLKTLSTANKVESNAKDSDLKGQVSTENFGNMSVDLREQSVKNNSHQNKTNLTGLGQYDNVNYCKQPVQAISAVYSVFLFVVILITVTGNTTVFTGILLSRALRKQTMYFFLASLAFSDVLVAVSTLPIKIKQTLDNQHFCMSLDICKFLYVSDTMFATTSITHLLVIAVDRLLQIKIPYVYPKLITKVRSSMVIMLVWLYSAIWAALSTFDWSNPATKSISIDEYNQRVCLNDNKIYYIVLYSAVFITPLLVMIIAYSFILKVAWGLEREIINNELPLSACGRKRTLYMRELRASKTVVAVFTAFIVCYLPVCAMTFSSFLDPNIYNEFRGKHPNGFLAVYVIFVQTLPPLNHCVNPFIYVIMNRKFRYIFKAALFRLLGKPVSHNTYASSVSRRKNSLNSRRRSSQQQGNSV